MTLYINIVETSNLPSRGQLIIDGSKAGLLATKDVETSYKLKNSFLIKCASDDILTFKLVKAQAENSTAAVIATGTLLVPALIKKHHYQLPVFIPNKSNISNNEPLEASGVRTSAVKDTLPYDIQMYGNDGITEAGTLRCTLAYDKVSYYQGQFIAPSQKSVLPVVKNVKKRDLYNGKVNTKNLFSCIDPVLADQDFKFVESHYKDQN